MTHWKNYYLAKTIDDALNVLTNSAGPARLVAGGTDLLLDIQQGRHAPVDTLVDVTAVPELTALEVRQDQLFVGAAVPLNRIVASPLVGQQVQALQEACGLIGGPQVRNTATLGGNVAHALPAGDGTIALMALDARAEVADGRGCRLVPIGELFLGPGRSALAPQAELLVGFYLPLKSGETGDSGEGSAFRRVMRPQGVAIAILNMAIWVSRRGGRIADVRIAIGPSGPTPRRLPATEAALRGRVFHPSLPDEIMPTLLGEVQFRTSPHRATSEYRRHLAGTLLAETLTVAWERTGDERDSKAYG